MKMLNYKELSSRFTEILSSFSVTDVKEWLEFDNQRESLERLTNGESITMLFEDFPICRLHDKKEEILISQSAGNYQYAMAA